MIANLILISADEAIEAIEMKKVPCEVFSRVVGYYRPVIEWNKGKQEEFKDRFPLKVNPLKVNPLD